MITGTAYFVSLKAAERYYADYGYSDIKAAVRRKLAEGEIHLGKPALKPGQSLTMLDNGARYGIEDGQP